MLNRSTEKMNPTRKKIVANVVLFLQAENPSEFGHSWAIDPDACQAPDPEDPCDEESKEYEDALDLCYTLILETGPFRDCHELVDPTPYYEACVYDLCATLPDDDVLCDSLAEYGQACREAGSSPGDWRAETPQCGKFEDSY